MMSKKILICFLYIQSLLLATQAFAVEEIVGIEKYQIDKTHTNIMWYIGHMGFSRTIGNFKEFEGTVDINFDEPDKSKIYITIDTKSISSGVDDLDQQLKSELFFYVDKYPKAIFESTDIKLIEKDTAEVKGNLTMLGKTKEVMLNVRFNKRGMDPILNKIRTGYSIKASIKRSKWGMDKMLAFIADDINIVIEAEAIKITPPKTTE